MPMLISFIRSAAVEDVDHSDKTSLNYHVLIWFDLIQCIDYIFIVTEKLKKAFLLYPSFCRESSEFLLKCC